MLEMGLLGIKWWLSGEKLYSWLEGNGSKFLKKNCLQSWHSSLGFYDPFQEDFQGWLKHSSGLHLLRLWAELSNVPAISMKTSRQSVHTDWQGALLGFFWASRCLTYDQNSRWSYVCCQMIYFRSVVRDTERPRYQKSKVDRHARKFGRSLVEFFLERNEGRKESNFQWLSAT